MPRKPLKNGTVPLSALSRADLQREAAITARALAANPHDQEAQARQTAVLSESHARDAVTLDDQARRLAERACGQRIGLPDVKLGNYLKSAARGMAPTGAELELNQELGLSGDQVPWSALARDVPRMATVTAPTGTRRQDPILDRVFDRSVAMALGTQMEMVDPGSVNYPVFLTGAPGVVKAKDAAIGGSATTFSNKLLSPIRATARYEFAIEDAAVTADLEEALRADLGMAIMDRIDALSLTGTGADSQPLGFMTDSADGLVHPADPGALATFGEIVGQSAKAVDGKYAAKTGEIVHAVNPDLYGFMDSLIDVGSATSSLEVLERKSMGVYASPHVPVAAATIAKGVAYRSGSMQKCAVCPIWQGMSLIRDEYSGSGKGHVFLTAIALFNFAILRPDAYKIWAGKVA